MNRQTFDFKRDQYLGARGGRPHFLNIYCDHCGGHVLLYQKDNPGKLKRLYLDRIISPQPLAELNDLPTDNIPQLRCNNCNRLLAVVEDYDNEPRKVYLLLSFATIHKVTKGIYPPVILKLDLDHKKK